MITPSRQSSLVSSLSLFTSVGTLLCCALPSLLVLLGLGATVASGLSAIPWLVTLSRHKAWVFTAAGVLVAGNFFYVYRLSPRLRLEAAACSPEDPGACGAAGHFSRVILWISAGICLVGFSVAYVLGPILMRFSS